MKKVLKGKHFASVEQVKQKMAEALKGIKIDKFKNGFEQWKKCLYRCIASNREYFKGDKFKHIRINTRFSVNKFWQSDNLIAIQNSAFICIFVIESPLMSLYCNISIYKSECVAVDHLQHTNNSEFL